MVYNNGRSVAKKYSNNNGQSVVKERLSTDGPSLKKPNTNFFCNTRPSKALSTPRCTTKKINFARRRWPDRMHVLALDVSTIQRSLTQIDSHHRACPPLSSSEPFTTRTAAQPSHIAAQVSTPRCPGLNRTPPNRSLFTTRRPAFPSKIFGRRLPKPPLAGHRPPRSPHPSLPTPAPASPTAPSPPLHPSLHQIWKSSSKVIVDHGFLVPNGPSHGLQRAHSAATMTSLALPR
jgi:hypothetical protein